MQIDSNVNGSNEGSRSVRGPAARKYVGTVQNNSIQ